MAFPIIELISADEDKESKAILLHEAHKYLKVGDTIHIRRENMMVVPKAKSESIMMIEEFSKLKERIEVLERIVTVLLIDDEFKDIAKKAAKEMGLTNVQS